MYINYLQYPYIYIKKKSFCGILDISILLAEKEEKLKLTLVSIVNLVNIVYLKNDENIIAGIFNSLVINFPCVSNLLC